MTDIFAALKALLVGLGYEVYVVDVPTTPSFPYVVLWASGGNLSGSALDGVLRDLDEPLGVTTVAESADGVWKAQQRVRDALHDHTPAVAGRDLHELRLRDSRPLEVDRDVTITGSNRHPVFGVDMYRLVASS